MSGKIVAVVGNSGCGKTLLLEKLICKLTSAKVNFAVFKHTHHKKFSLDLKGKDTFRYFLAGAKNISIFSNNKCAIVRWIESRSINIHKIISSYFPDVKLVFIEGMRKSNFDKILVVKNFDDIPKLTKKINKILCIVVSNDKIKTNYEKIPVFKIKDVNQITQFLISKLNI